MAAAAAKEAEEEAGASQRLCAADAGDVRPVDSPAAGTENPLAKSSAATHTAWGGVGGGLLTIAPWAQTPIRSLVPPPSSTPTRCRDGSPRIQVVKAAVLLNHHPVLPPLLCPHLTSLQAFPHPGCQSGCTAVPPPGLRPATPSPRVWRKCGTTAPTRCGSLPACNTRRRQRCSPEGGGGEGGSGRGSWAGTKGKVRRRGWVRDGKRSRE